MAWLALPLALLGHVALWLRFINHAHSFHFGCRPTRWLSRAAMTMMAGVPLLILGVDFTQWKLALLNGGWPQLSIWSTVYLGACLLGGTLAIAAWMVRKTVPKEPEPVQANRKEMVNVQLALGKRFQSKGPRHLFTKLPGNQVFHLEVIEKELLVPRLPAALDGLVIAHLTDLHFVGTVPIEFFAEAVRIANSWSPDLVAITGDLVDDSKYIDWVPETLGKLSARYGSYYVLGNHDLRIDFRRLRTTLADTGLVDLGGKTHQLEIGDSQLLLAGNERPWFGPAPFIQPKHQSPENRPLRLVLSHSPDQFRWARRHDFDLMLAGHTHGGQIHFPGVGPLWSPTHRGVTYSSGTFYKSPTIMHVSRGLSGLTPLRLNCAPELTKLVLRSPLANASPV